MKNGVLVNLPGTEAESRRYLQSLCRENNASSCPRCHSREIYPLASGRHRCRRCQYTFSEFSGRWLSQGRLHCSEWVRVVSLFAEERPVESIARTLGRAYATAFHAVTVLRAGILAHSRTGSTLLYDNPGLLRTICRHRGRKAINMAGHAPVFGIREEADTVSVPALPDVDPDLVLGLPVKKVRRGNIVYTGQVPLYDTLMFAIAEKAATMDCVHFCRSPVYIDGTRGFWAYACPRLAAHHGISAGHFPLYLKELEFRYNHRHEALEPLLLQYLCDQMPQRVH
jgi:transposase